MGKFYTNSRNPWTVVLLLLAGTLSFQLSGQGTGASWHFMDQATIPVPTEEMPDYARLLYNEVVNYEAALALHKEYYTKGGIEKWHEDLEQDPYAKFFFHWLREAKNFMDAEGNVRQLTTEEMLRMRAKDAPRQTTTKSDPGETYAAEWRFVGPKRTLWREDQNPGLIAPWQVNIYCMDVSLSDPDRIFVGGETGEVYFTNDKGMSWTPVKDYNFGRAIHSVAIHPTNPDEVVIGTATDVIRTTDGGVSWAPVLSAAALSVNTLRYNKAGTAILAGTAQGIMRTTDGGANWTNTLAEEIMDVVYQPNNDDEVYAVTRRASPRQCMFYKSTDGGQTFSLSMSGWEPYADDPDGGGARMDVTNANDAYIYVGLLTENNTPIMVKSTDGGNSWAEVAQGNTPELGLNNGQGYYDLDVVINDLNEEEVIFATTTAYRSVDGGVNYAPVGGYAGDFAIHPDMQEMVSIGGDTWIATDGGMNYSTDFFTDVVNWQVRIDGLDGTHFWGYDQGWNEDFMIGGRYHNGNTALHENYPEGFALRLGGAESATGHAWHGKERHAIFDDITNLVIPREIDEAPEGSFDFTKDSPNDYRYGAVFSNLLVDREDYQTLYIGEGNDLWKTTDGGISWESIRNFGEDQVWNFDISRADPNVFYLLANNGVYKSTDRGETFDTITTPPGVPANRIWSMRIAVSGTDADEVWLLDENAGGSSGEQNRPRVWFSNDGGSSWMSWHTPTLEGRTYRALSHHIGSNGGVYITSDRSGTPGALPAKIFYRDKSMTDWLDCSKGFPASAEVQKTLPYYRGNVLRWAGNRGVWELPLVEQDWAPIAQPFMNGQEVLCPSDTVRFDSYSVNKEEATYSWSIPEAASTTDLSEREVAATFSSPGTYTATLTITQNGQSDSKAIEFNVGDNCSPDLYAGNAITMGGVSTAFVAMNEPLDITTNTMTMSAWIKPEGAQVDVAAIIMKADATISGVNFRASGTLGIHWSDQQWWWDSGLTPVLGEWNHVAMTVAPDNVTLYLNGVPSVNTFDVTPVSFGTPLIMGKDGRRTNRNFSGEMDEVIVYNRTLSQAEVRELMHLTRKPAEETDMLVYYQFNREEGIITNRTGGIHATLGTDAERVISTAPVGPGESARLEVTSPGTYNFADADLSLEFGSGELPNGELLVTRIDAQPDQLPEVAAVTGKYWVVHEFGMAPTQSITKDFAELVEMTFGNVGTIAPDLADMPETVQLFKRPATAHGETWGSAVATATEVEVGSEGRVTFGPGNGQTSFGQYILGFEEGTLSLPLVTDNRVTMYPNPLPKNQSLNVMPDDNANYTLELYTIAGKRIGSYAIRGETKLPLKDLPAGVYSWQMRGNDYRAQGMIVLE